MWQTDNGFEEFVNKKGAPFTCFGREV